MGVRVRTPERKLRFRSVGNMKPKKFLRNFLGFEFLRCVCLGKYACGALVALVLRTSRIIGGVLPL
jgi:hypothetical protein